jgi:hypothetical protein
MERMEQRHPLPNRPWRHARSCAIALAIAACVTLAAASSRAGGATSLYQWTDEDGVIRYTPDRAHIPASRRGSAVHIEPTPSFSDAIADAQVPAAREAPRPSPPAPGSTIGRRDTVSAPPQPAPRPAATARPAPETPPDPAPRYVYVIQLRATRQSAVSPPLPRLDLPDGYRLFRTTFEKDGRVWERVRVGFFATLADARAMRSRLEPRFPGAWIDRVRGAQRIASSGMAAPPRP